MLTSLKIIACLMVLAAHAAALYGAQGGGGWLGSIAADGWLLLLEFDVLVFVVLMALVAAGFRLALLTWFHGGLIVLMAFAHVVMIGQVGFSSSLEAHAAESLKEDQATMTLSLMQGNTQSKGNPFGWNYDVVMLCEVGLGGDESHWEQDAEKQGLKKAVGPRRGLSDTAIYTKFPVIDSGVVGEPLDGWAQGSWAKVATAHGELLLVSVHTRSPTSESWARSRNEFFVQMSSFLMNQPKELPIIVAGDMNATPNNAAFRDFLSHGKWSQEPNAWYPTWHTWWAEKGIGFRIDRTLGLQGASILKWNPLKGGVSDHLFSSSLIRVEHE